MGGTLDSPSYRDVCTGTTGHAEVGQVSYDPDRIGYGELHDAFFDMHNPTTLNRQGPDRGSQYRSVIFTHDETQAEQARARIAALEEQHRWNDPIVTAVEPASSFWRAEEYHQRYLEKNGAAHCAI